MCKPERDEKYIIKPHLRTEREKVKKEHEEIHQKAMMILGEMFEGWTGEGTQDVKKKDMMSFPMMEWQEIDVGVWIRRRADLHEMIVFDTLVLEGSEFGIHFHSDCIEICDLENGGFIDKIYNKAYRKNSQVYMEKGMRHHLKAIDCEPLKNLKSIGLPFDECIGTKLKVYFK